MLTQLQQQQNVPKCLPSRRVTVNIYTEIFLPYTHNVLNTQNQIVHQQNNT